jgi:hypothetical protein
MTTSPRKISLAQCIKQGNFTVTIWRVSPGERAPYGGGPNVCGHKRELPIGEAIRLLGLETSLSDLRVRCTVCGGRAYDARGEATRGFAIDGLVVRRRRDATITHGDGIGLRM